MFSFLIRNFTLYSIEFHRRLIFKYLLRIFEFHLSICKFTGVVVHETLIRGHNSIEERSVLCQVRNGRNHPAIAQYALHNIRPGKAVVYEARLLRLF